MKGLVTIKNPNNIETPVVYAGQVTLSSGTTTVVTVTGVLATDTVVATGNTDKAVTIAVPSANTITLTHTSASGTEKASYIVLRHI